MRSRSQIDFGRTGQHSEDGRLNRMHKLGKAGEMRGSFGGDNSLGRDKMNLLFLREQSYLKDLRTRKQRPRRDT